MYASSSTPNPHVPDAVMTGFLRVTAPTCVAKCGDRDRSLTAGDTPGAISLRVDALVVQIVLARPPTLH